MTCQEKKFKNVLAERLLKVMKDHGLSQKAFAEKVGTSQPQISRGLKGSQKISAELVAKTAAVFGIDPGWLLTGQEPPARTAPVIDEETERIIHRVLHILDSDQAKTLKGIIDVLFGVATRQHPGSAGGIEKKYGIPGGK